MYNQQTLLKWHVTRPVKKLVRHFENDSNLLLRKIQTTFLTSIGINYAVLPGNHTFSRIRFNHDYDALVIYVFE